MKGLEVTLMERLIKSQGEQVVRMLTTQYRMNAAIMTWSSEALYEGRLRAGAEVAAHTLADLEHVTAGELTQTVLLLIDTAGCDMPEFSTADGVSKGESWLVHMFKNRSFGNLLRYGTYCGSILYRR